MRQVLSMGGFTFLAVKGMERLHHLKYSSLQPTLGPLLPALARSRPDKDSAVPASRETSIASVVSTASIIFRLWNCSIRSQVRGLHQPSQVRSRRALVFARLN